MKRLLFLALPIALFAGCAPTPPEPEPAPPPPPPPPAPEPIGKWTEWPLAEGQWVYRRDARGSIALFGPASRDALFTIRCDSDARQIYLSRAGQLAAGNIQMTLRAHSGDGSYAASNSGGNPPYAAIRLNPRDMILDRLSFARGHFAVDVTGMAGVAIPARPEFARVVEDCRR